jgi:hypothetical protein
LPAAFANLRRWKASSYSPLEIDLANRGRRRRSEPIDVVCAHRGAESR